MELLYCDDRIIVCVKPAGVLSTDEPGGLPELIRGELGDPNAVVRTVHRLDRAVGGLMVLARTARAASDLSAQIRNGTFEKEYQAIVHGQPPKEGLLQDLLYRDKARRMTIVAEGPGKDVQPAQLQYRVLGANEKMSRLQVRLITGRTHQIRVQFSSRGWPLAGDKKYGSDDAEYPIALWSCHLAFDHPRTGERLVFDREPPAVQPWTDV